MPDEAIPKKTCRVCGKPMPAAARYCVECQHWQISPRFLFFTSAGGAVATLVASVGIPLFLYYATQSYGAAESARAQADVARVREAEMLGQLSKAVQETIAVTDRFRLATQRLEAACTPASMRQGDAEIPASCRDAFVAALSELDDVVGDLAWAIDTVPVKRDTYARLNNLKYAYSRSCPNEVPTANCGFRQHLVRYLHGAAQDEWIALKRCAGAVGDDVQRCVAAREAMKTHVIVPLRSHVNDLLCSITRDANELKVMTWQSMEGETSQFYDALASRLEDTMEHSDCSRRLRANPISSTCPYGVSMDGACL
jgi:hypothetical protein